jgi:hypothetical protein
MGWSHSQNRQRQLDARDLERGLEIRVQLASKQPFNSLFLLTQNLFQKIYLTALSP